LSIFFANFCPYHTYDFSSAAIFYWPFSSVINRNRNRPFNLIQNKVGYRSCFATGVKLEQFSWNSFDVKYILEVIYCRPDCALNPNSPHSGTNTKIKWDMCLCILNIILRYVVGTCLWLCWKLTLNTHFLFDFIYFHETIDFSLTSEWNFMCYYTKVYINIIPTIHKKYRKQNKPPKRKLVRQIILEINSLDM
jgi:hypothetical protein